MAAVVTKLKDPIRLKVDNQDVAGRNLVIEYWLVDFNGVKTAEIPTGLSVLYGMSWCEGENGAVSTTAYHLGTDSVIDGTTGLTVSTIGNNSLKFIVKLEGLA